MLMGGLHLIGSPCLGTSERMRLSDQDTGDAGVASAKGLTKPAFLTNRKDDITWAELYFNR